MKAREEDKRKSGIYCILNKITGKIYIGKSKNIYKRIVQHLYDLRLGRKRCENAYFMNAWNKYGIDSFTYFVVEEAEISVLSERELFWINKLDSVNRNIGYNLRRDSSTSMIVHDETRQKQAKNLKQQWEDGIRDGHSQKLKDNWNNNLERKQGQSKLFSQIKTKYTYRIFNQNKEFIEECFYSRLLELKLQNVQATFHKKKTNVVNFKSFIIERVALDDIVQAR